MLCYQCLNIGNSQPAVGLCHHCSAALCLEHSQIVADPVTTTHPISHTVVLPLHARLFFCKTCLAALEQAHAYEREPEACDVPAPAAA